MQHANRGALEEMDGFPSATPTLCLLREKNSPVRRQAKQERTQSAVRARLRERRSRKDDSRCFEPCSERGLFLYDHHPKRPFGVPVAWRCLAAMMFGKSWLVACRNGLRERRRPHLTLLARCALLMLAEVLANALIWIVTAIVFTRGGNRGGDDNGNAAGANNNVLGLALIAWTTGLRHGLDADHISGASCRSRLAGHPYVALIRLT